MNTILCSYINTTNRTQVIRIIGFPHYQFERVVFPGQELMFEAASEAQLEVFTSSPISAMLADRICCDRLKALDSSRVDIT